MNRIDELNKMIEESMEVPEALNMDAIKRGTKRKVFRHHVVTSVRNTAIALVVLMGTLTIGVNTSAVFASTMKNIPLIGQLASAVEFNTGVSDAASSDYGIEIGQKVKGKYSDMEVSYVMADDRSVVLFLKASDDGGKYSGDIEVEKMIDTDTGEEITAGYVLPEIKTDGEYATLIYDWGNYHKNIAVDLKFSIRDDDYNEVCADEYSYSFSVGDKYEPKIYEVDQDYDFGGAKYHIGQVRVYPMSTEIDIDNLNEDEYYTEYLDVELVDENGQARGIPTEGLLGRYIDDKYCTVLDGGYFAYKGDLKLHITKVELLSTDRREVTLNLDTLKFTDLRGELKEISDVKRDGDYICFRVDSVERKYDNIFDGYIDENGADQNLEFGVSSEYLYINLKTFDGKKIYVNDNNEITLMRQLPDTVIKPDLIIDLSL